MIRSLLWKDFRLAIPAQLTAALLFTASFVCSFLLAHALSIGPFPWMDSVVTSAHFCQWSMIIVAALLGGSAFASEKEDRSFRFFFGLPTQPRDALMSKLVVTLLVFECLWIVTAVVMHASAPFAAFGSRDKLPGAADMTTIMSFSLLVLGVSWAWSALLNKPIVAAILGFFTSGLILTCVYAGATLFARSEPEIKLDSIAPSALALGILGLVAGARLYLRQTFEQTELSISKAHRTRAIDATSARLAFGQTAPSRLNPRQALLWKDWRLVKTVLGVSTALLLVPYLFPVLIALAKGDALPAFARASTQSLWLSCLVFPLWGGYVVSSERASKTDRFLNSLPVAPFHVVGSRLVLTLTPALFIFLVNIGASLTFHNLTLEISPVHEPVDSILQMTWGLLIWQPDSLLFALPIFGAPLLCFGVSWFASITLKRPFLGIGFGAATSGLVLLTWLSVIALAEEALLPVQAALLFLVAGCVAAAAFIGLGYRELKRADTP